MLRKMDEEARREKAKTNQNLSKLLSLIEAHNSALNDIESKFKKEFFDINDNIKKIKKYQKEQEKIKAENLAYQKELENKRKQELPKIAHNITKKQLEKEEQQNIGESPDKKTNKFIQELNTYKDSRISDDIGIVAFVPSNNVKANESFNINNEEIEQNNLQSERSSTQERKNNRIKELYPSGRNIYEESALDEENMIPLRENSIKEAKQTETKTSNIIEVIERPPSNKKLANSSQINIDQSLKAPREIQHESTLNLKKKSEKNLSKQISPDPIEISNFEQSSPEITKKQYDIIDFTALNKEEPQVMEEEKVPTSIQKVQSQKSKSRKSPVESENSEEDSHNQELDKIDSAVALKSSHHRR